MAEFKFTCAQCGQHIQCDTSYAGMQIDCPVCQQSIVVPPPPRAAAPRVAPAAAKKSRVLQKTLYVVATVIILAALVIGGWYGYSKFKFGHLPPGSVAVWSVEGNGLDPAGGHNGEVMPGVGFEPGKGGRAFHFTGDDNSYVKVPDAPELRLTNVLTITFWFKKLQLQGRPYGEYIINKGGDWTHGELNYGVGMDPGLTVTSLGFFFAGGNRHAGSISDTEWHHYAIVATNGQPDPVFYIDGQIQTISRREGAATINLFPSTDPLYIGAQVDAASGYFYYSKSKISELALYNRALSAEEIQRLYAAQK